jgi:hypothetical protein
MNWHGVSDHDTDYQPQAASEPELKLMPGPLAARSRNAAGNACLRL